MKPGQLKIRPAKPEEEGEIDAFDEFAGDRGAEIGAGLCLVAEIEGRIAGYVSWAEDGFVGNPLVLFLCVDPAHRRQGVGSTLLAGAERRIRGGKIFVSTEAHNAAMLSLLAKQGWTLAGSVANANEDGATEAFFVKQRLGALAGIF